MTGFLHYYTKTDLEDAKVLEFVDAKIALLFIMMLLF